MTHALKATAGPIPRGDIRPNDLASKGKRHSWSWWRRFQRHGHPGPWTHQATASPAPATAHPKRPLPRDGESSSKRHCPNNII